MSFDLPGVKPGSDFETLFKAVGFVVVQWGFAEQSLDLTVASIFHFYHGHPLIKRRPSLLKSKLDFLSQCFAELPNLHNSKKKVFRCFLDLPWLERNETILYVGPLQRPQPKTVRTCL